MKIVLTFVVALIALAAHAQKPSISFEDGHYTVRGLPMDWKVQYGAKDDDSNLYYILAQKSSPDSLYVWYGTDTALEKSKVKKIENKYATYNVSFQTTSSVKSSVFAIPLMASVLPWLNDDENTLTPIPVVQSN